MIYKEKNCAVCGNTFIPNSPNQKYCSSCKSIGRRVVSRERERDISRNKFGYELQEKKCKICGTVFYTYYKKKIYCGSESCEKERIAINQRAAISKKNAKLRKLTKLKKQEVLKTKVEEITNYVEKFGYKLLDYSDYKNSHSGLLKLLCPNGHEWHVTYHGFKDNNCRCMKCYVSNNYISKPELKIRNFIEKDLKNINVIYNDRSKIPPKELDFYFPDNNVAVEVCGLYWHGEISSGKDKSYHYDKMMLCQGKGIRLITVFEDEVNDKFDLVCSRIKNALGLIDNVIYARKCVIKELSTKEANSFFESNHIQGTTTFKKAFGLVFNDIIVSACCVGNMTRSNANITKTLELKRFCSDIRYRVVGGASKLFKEIKNYAIANEYVGIKSYCDMRYANFFNSVYELLGFKELSRTKYTPHYFINGTRFRNMSLRKTSKERETGKTEWELRRAQGYDRIWDCGHITYYLKL